MHSGGFDVIVGNPPYVEYSVVKKAYKLIGYSTIPCNNLYAYVIERSLSVLRKGARIGMIVQLPMVCTDRMIPLQDVFLSESSCSWFATFDDRPGRLFDGLEHIRATICLARIGSKSKESSFSTTYNRWGTEFRAFLFDSLRFLNTPSYRIAGSIPKIGEKIAQDIYKKIVLNSFVGSNIVNHQGADCLYFHNAPQYWIRAMARPPYFWNEVHGEKISTQVKSLGFSSRRTAVTVLALLNSSIFYWWFIILSDCRHLNMREIESFPLGFEKMTEPIKSHLIKYAERLMVDYEKNKVRKECQYKATGRVVYDEYYPKHSKGVIDCIDAILLEHYALTDEELDFIINYDIKYRMGRDAEEEGEDA